MFQTKKRYVGYMYESPSQTTPTYDAKGIETVRRDGCPAVAKVSVLELGTVGLGLLALKTHQIILL